MRILGVLGFGVLGFGVGGVRAVGLSSTVGAACLYVANNFTNYPFNCPHPDINYACRCRDPAFLGTILLCVEDVADTYETVTDAYHFVLDVCRLQAAQTYRFKDLVRMGETASRSAVPFADRGLLLAVPVRPNRELYTTAHRSVSSLVSHRIRATVYGGWSLGYWGLIAVLGVLNNVAVWCLPLFSASGLYPRWLHRHLLSPKILGRNVNRPRGTLLGRWLSQCITVCPTRIQSVTIMGYLVLLVVLLTTNYGVVRPNAVFGAECIARNVYIGDRAGIIAITQLPLLFAFTARNNLFSVVTGWPYRTFNIFHRWIARFVVVLILLHAVFYYDTARLNGDYIERWGLLKWRWAHVGIISSFVLVLTSAYPVRAHFYELFKGLHQVFSALFVVGTWYHCVTLGWMEFLYVTLGLWVLDHLIRFFKIVVSGGVVTATCRLVTSPGEPLTGHTLRVTINHSGYWRHYPGCYVFLYFLRPGTFWQSHPFTTIEPAVVQAANQLVFCIRVKKGLTLRLSDYLLTQPDHTANIKVLVEGPYGSPIGFRGYENAIFVAGGIGITVVYTLALDLARQFKAELLREGATSSSRTITVFWITPSTEAIDAAVDEIAMLSRIGNVRLLIFISRQTGCEGLDKPVGLRCPSQEDLKSNQGLSGSPPPTPVPADWARERQAALGIEPTPPGMDTNDVKESPEKGSAKSTQGFPHPPDASQTPPAVAPSVRSVLYGRLPRVTVYWGSKPCMKQEVAERAALLTGPLAVVSCGPDRLNCDTRDGVVKALGKSRSTRIEYFEEKLLW